MASFKQRYDAKKKKDAIGLLKAFAEKIKNGEFEVDTAAHWNGSVG